MAPARGVVSPRGELPNRRGSTVCWFHVALVDAPFNGCRDILPGSSGSPVISDTARVAIAVVNTTTIGAGPLTECALGHPCELFAGGARARPHTTYATSVAGIDTCFNGLRHFDVAQPGCPLEAAIEPAAVPAYIGPVKPICRSSIRRCLSVRRSPDGSHEAGGAVQNPGAVLERTFS